MRDLVHPDGAVGARRGPPASEVEISNPKRVSDIDVQIGRRVRLLREHRGISREAVARALNVSQQQLQKYEAGQNRISAGRLPKFAQLFGVPVSHFFEDLAEQDGNGNSRNGSSAATVVGMTAQCIALIRMFQGIKNPKARATILALVSSLADNEESSRV